MYLLESRVGHLYQALHLFKYLKVHKCSKCVFDPNYVGITDNQIPVKKKATYQEKFTKELHPDAVEDLSLNAPKPKVRAFQISCFVDADHGGYQINRISRTGILVLLNRDPIMWSFKQKKYSGEFYVLFIVCSNESGCGNVKGSKIQASNFQN